MGTTTHRAVLGVVAFILAIGLIASCQSGVTPSSHEPPADFIRPADLAGLVDASDLVVLGSVAANSKGRQAGPAGEVQVQFLATELKVERVLAGGDRPDILTVETEERGTPYTREWRRSGIEIVAFLVEKEQEPGSYRPLAYETVLTADGEDMHQTVADTDWDLIAEMASMPKSQLAESVREANGR